MKIAFNFYTFFCNSHFLFILILWFIFPLRKIKKNSNFKGKSSKIWINNVCYQISNKFVDFFGFENANYFNRKAKKIVFYTKNMINTTFYVFYFINYAFSMLEKSANLFDIPDVTTIYGSFPGFEMS